MAHHEIGFFMWPSECYIFSVLFRIVFVLFRFIFLFLFFCVCRQTYVLPCRCVWSSFSSIWSSFTLIKLKSVNRQSRLTEVKEHSSCVCSQLLPSNTGGNSNLQAVLPAVSQVVRITQILCCVEDKDITAFSSNFCLWYEIKTSRFFLPEPKRKRCTACQISCKFCVLRQLPNFYQVRVALI